MIFELVAAMDEVSAIYYYWTEGHVVKKPKGQKGGDCVTSLASVSGYLQKVKEASSIVMEIDSWKKRFDKKYSVGQKLDTADAAKLGATSWKWILKLRSIGQEFDKEQRTLNLIEERMKSVQKSVEERMKNMQMGVTPILESMKEYMSKIQSATLTFVESSPTVRSLEPTLRGLLNRTNSGELVLAGYFDQYLLKDFQAMSPKPPIKFISPELTNSKQDKINLDALQRLNKMGAKVGFHKMLHARMVLSPTEIVVGSADIKSDCLGGRRYDAGIWSNNPVLVQSGKVFIDKVWSESTPLS